MNPLKKPDHLGIEEFNNPYTGIAAMILFQAIDDLRMLDGAEKKKCMGYWVKREEIIGFFQTDWALALVENFGYDINLLQAIVAGAYG